MKRKAILFKNILAHNCVNASCFSAQLMKERMKNKQQQSKYVKFLLFLTPFLSLRCEEAFYEALKYLNVNFIFIACAKITLPFICHLFTKNYILYM